MPMSSLAEFPELVGFFSYSREDDEAFKGELSALRDRIQRELSAQLGRTKSTFRLWQDQVAISPGKEWETEIKKAVDESVFFIPIVTPRTITSKYCKFEFEAFLARENALGRRDLIFPILYLPVDELEDEAKWRADPVLLIIARRQFVDWRTLRHDDQTPQVRKQIENLCRKIVEALKEPWIPPEERRRMEEAKARKQAEEEDARRLEADAKRKAEEEQHRRQAEARARQQVEEERVQAERQAEKERKRAQSKAKREAEARRKATEEAETKRKAEKKEKERPLSAQPSPQSPSPPATWKQSVEKYEKAADNGDVSAMFALGTLFHAGSDYAKAREWYEKAADRGEAQAMRGLGLLYSAGEGVAQDYAKAREWFEKAVASGDVGTKDLLESHKAAHRAAEVVRRAAEAAHRDAAWDRVGYIIFGIMGLGFLGWFLAKFVHF
jgi:hypothetical protein